MNLEVNNVGTVSTSIIDKARQEASLSTEAIINSFEDMEPWLQQLQKLHPTTAYDIKTDLEGYYLGVYVVLPYAAEMLAKNLVQAVFGIDGGHFKSVQLDSDSNRNRVFLSKCADFFTLYLLLHVL
jgi:hypothetical protein